MIVGGVKYRAVLNEPTVAIAPVTRPDAAATIAPGATAGAIEDARVAHKILWREFFLQQAIDSAGVAAIARAVDEQYIAALKKDYVGFAGVTIYSMIKHLRTWYKITNAQKLAIKARFEAPWTETPDAHVSTYARQLDRRQAECLELEVAISDDDKILHFVGQMINSDVFDRKFIDDWEDQEGADWAATRSAFADEYDKIGRARARAAERAGAEYNSAAALTQRAAPPAPPPDPGMPQESSGAFSALSDYAAALELRVNELETGAETQSLPSVVGATSETASAVTQTVASAELTEMRALAAKLAAANTQQQKQLAAALARLDSGSSTRSDGPRRRRGAPREKHRCVNCKRMVFHADDNCMELEKNAHLRYEGWKSCLE